MVRVGAGWLAGVDSCWVRVQGSQRQLHYAQPISTLIVRAEHDVAHALPASHRPAPKNAPSHQH